MVGDMAGICRLVIALRALEAWMTGEQVIIGIG